MSDRPQPSADPTPFRERLAGAVARHGSLCVGIDPHPGLLAQWGLEDSPAGLERLARTAAEAVAGRVAVAKPQSAFFERFGSAGVAVLERVLGDLREAGVLSLLDVKRGDIGSTMSAYADAYLGDGSPLRADAITVSPYLGVGALAPAVELADATGRGLFVLARTSNPEGGDVQQARVSDGAPMGDGAVDAPTVAQSVVDQAQELNRAHHDLLGLVVGGTHDDPGVALTGFTGAVLIPGYGAQGAGAEDIARRFASVRALLLPTSSRGILSAGPSTAALRARIDDDQQALARALGSPRP